MSNIIVDGFATYGVGTIDGNGSAIKHAMLAGAWASIGGSGSDSIGHLPWDPSNTDLYYSQADDQTDTRRVLPASLTTCVVSMYYALNFLPPANAWGHIIAFRDDANKTGAALVCQSTGALALYDGVGNILLSTSGPVIVAETATHLEMKITLGSGAFELRVGGTTVMAATGLVFTAPGSPNYVISNVSQLNFVKGPNSLGSIRTQYMSNLIIRDTAGTVNNDFVGDRRVATLLVNSDDVAHQGWTGQPRHRFGTGILDNTAASSGVTAANTTQTDLGSGDFTIETNVRFQTLPTDSNKAVIFGKWDETNNRRSYQLYLGGPTLDNGYLTFRTSTDGLAGTVVNVLQWPWLPDTDTWYHVALVRSAGELLLFINGVQQGLPVADAATYFAGIEYTCLGCQYDTTFVANTGLDGWFDEFRLTVGIGRYVADFAPPTTAFGRDVASDPDFASVAWLSGFDSGVFDESSYGRTLTKRGSAASLTPDDGTANYQTMNKGTPFDDTFTEAALIAATAILTQTAQPTDGQTVTVGTKAAATPAVYTWKAALTGTAFEVLIDTTLTLSLANLCSAINLGSGIGVKYGTGTTANLDVTATQLPVEQIEAEAITAGTTGNSIACSTTATNGAWSGTHLAGGVDIPAYSQFGLERPPNNTTVIDSVTILQRTFKTDAGAAQVQASFVGPLGTAAAGGIKTITTVPTLYFDTFETDPDTAGSITPATVVSGFLRLNRTA